MTSPLIKGGCYTVFYADNALRVQSSADRWEKDKKTRKNKNENNSEIEFSRN